MSYHVFDDPDIDVPKHCGRERTWCFPKLAEHLVSEPNLGISIPWPDSLHVRFEHARCGCICDDCQAVNALFQKGYDAAALRSFEAYKTGKPIVDPRCTLCKMERKSCGPKRTSRARKTS